MGMEVSRERSKHHKDRATGATVLGARRVSPVFISQVLPSELQAAMASSDGHNITLEELEPVLIQMQLPYKHEEAMSIAGVRKRNASPKTAKEVAIVRNVRKAERRKRNAAKIAPAVDAFNERQLNKHK
jgi:predicted MarR family transcription regulator